MISKTLQYNYANSQQAIPASARVSDKPDNQFTPAPPILTQPAVKLPSQRFPDMVTSSSVNPEPRRGLIIDILV